MNFFANMHEITYPLLLVFLVYLLLGQLGALILEIFKNAIVFNLGQLLMFVFEPCCPAHTALYAVLL